MSKVSITLKSGGAFVFTLYHSLYCESISACECTVAKVLRPRTEKDGSTGQQYFKVVYPKSVYLDEANPTVELADAAQKIPQVAEAKRRGLIEVKVVEDLPAPPAPTEPATSEDS